MIEKTLKDHLASQLSDPVYLDVPANPGARYYKLERTGGSEEDHIRHATFALQAIGPTLWETLQMHYRGIEAMRQSLRLPTVADMQLNADYNFTDTTRKQHRYQAVFYITHYEE